MEKIIGIKQVGSPEFPRYVILQITDKGNLYYNADNGWGTFKKALWFNSSHEANKQRWKCFEI